MSALVDVTFSSSKPYSQPYAMRLMQTEYKHDMALISIYNDNSDAKRYVSGTPLMVKYGFTPNLRIFYGYVNHVEQQSMPTAKTREARSSSVVVCVGTSFPLKDAANNAWAQQTASHMANDIASKFRLASSIQQNAQVWASIKQAGKSYWDLLVTYAQKIGFVVYCTGIVLHFHERDTNPNKLTGAIPFFNVSDTTRVKNFYISMGSESPYGGRLAIRQYEGVDLLTKQPYVLTDTGLPSVKTLGSATVAPLFTEIQNTLVASSSGQGQTLLDGQVSNNKLFVQAKMEIVGDARITQGMLIYVKNTPNSQDGLWYVLTADHQLEHGRFLTCLTLGRESVDSTRTYSFSATFAPQQLARVLHGNWIAA